MNIKPFKQEIADGLEQKVSQNSIAFASVLIKTDKPSVESTEKAVAAISGFGDAKNFDLYYIQAILASSGPNKNDDWFLPEEMWSARKTPVHKQLNYMHDEKYIIGAITDSILLSADGALISDESGIQQIKDIATQAVIWTHWDDENKAKQVRKIIASIEKGELYVSMEALFKRFDYALVRKDKFGQTVTIVPRTEETAFLTKHLRSMGGLGKYEDYNIYKVLRNFTFSGKGIVEDPANPRSVFDENLFSITAKASCNCESECDCEDDDMDDDYEEVDASLFEFTDAEDDFSAFTNETESSFAATDKKKKNVKLNKPFRTPGGPKKFSVYVKNDKGNIVKVNFGDPKMEIKRDDPNRRKNFRARHNCDNPGPKWKARYWSCKFWSKQDVSKLTSTKAENIMSDELFQKEIAELKAQLSTANETIASMRSAEAQKVAAQVGDLQSQVAALTAVASEAKAAMDKMEKEYAAKMSEMEKEKDEKMKSADAALMEVKAKLAEMESQKITAERVGKLIAAKVSHEKAEEVVKTFASLSDELFSQIIPLYEQKSTAGTDSGTTSVDDAISKAKASKNTDNDNDNKDDQGKDDRVTALSKSIASKLTFTKKQ